MNLSRASEYTYIEKGVLKVLMALVIHSMLKISTSVGIIKKQVSDEMS